MLIIFIIVTIIVGIWFWVVAGEPPLLSIIALAAEIIIMGCLIGSIVNGRVIDSKIKLIEKQNKDIEEKVEVTVKTYMNFEKDTLTEFKTDSYIQLVNLYPDLKSNELIQNQINLYEKNNKKITELKTDKLNISNYKWWVYFGK